jgi:bacteriophage N4 adsorption protein B
MARTHGPPRDPYAGRSGASNLSGAGQSPKKPGATHALSPHRSRTVNPAELVPALALMATLTRELLWLTAIAIMVSNLDDLAIDALWLFGVALRPTQPLPPPPANPGRYAILIPAWDEAAVIAAMLRNLVQSLDHPSYAVFIGVYPNDPATAAAVASVQDPRIVTVTTSAPGPTTKADCLNHLWRASLAHEQTAGVRFSAIVLHDAEDMVHAQELRLFDRHMPALAMVQLPVVPFPDPSSRWIAGHYIDEFAQNHGKDMMVRALLNTPVPSAGVATAIDREALQRLAGTGNAPFDATSLTEDYEIGHKLHRMGLPGRMIRHRVEGRLVATREYFPSTLEAAVRQKSRWLTGIALSGWDRLGWEGGPAARWMLLRDRKGLFTAAVAIMAYAALALVLGQLAVRALVAELGGAPLPPLILDSGNPALPAFLLFNAALLVWRLVLRFGFTAREHGLGEGLRAVPRAIVANLINALAAWRAVHRYRDALLTGGQPKWEKTAHRFPEPAAASHG